MIKVFISPDYMDKPDTGDGGLVVSVIIDHGAAALLEAKRDSLHLDDIQHIILVF